MKLKWTRILVFGVILIGTLVGSVNAIRTWTPRQKREPERGADVAMKNGVEMDGFGKVRSFSLTTFHVNISGEEWEGAILASSEEGEPVQRLDAIIAHPSRVTADIKLSVHENLLRLQRGRSQFAKAPIGSILICRGEGIVEAFALDSAFHVAPQGERLEDIEVRMRTALETALSREQGTELEFWRETQDSPQSVLN